MTDKKIPGIGASTKRVLSDFLDELKLDQEKKKKNAKFPQPPTERNSKSDIKLFSKKLSGQSASESSKEEMQNGLELGKCNKIVLSDEETNKLLSIKDKELFDN